MSKYTSERIDESVCLYKFTGVYHDYIYFDVKNTTSNESITAAIRTPWIINYEKKLVKSLENINKQDISVSVVKWNGQMESEFKCDWIHKAKFSEWAVNKGSVFVLNNNNAALVKSAVAIAITSLDDNYPMVEILLTVFGCFAAFAIYVFIHIKCTSSRNNSFYRNV